MGGRDLAIDALLGLGVAGELLCVAGIVVMRTTFDRLHYAAASTTIPAFLILTAAVLKQHFTAAGMETFAAVALLFVLNPALVIATARAARRIDYGSVAPLPEERGTP